MADYVSDAKYQGVFEECVDWSHLVPSRPDLAPVPFPTNPNRAGNFSATPSFPADLIFTGSDRILAEH